MKKIAALLFVVAAMLNGCSVSPRTEAETNAITQLREQAQIMLKFPDTYETKDIKTEDENDSLIHVTLVFSGKNAFGVPETNSVDGYFNINKGGERDFDYLRKEQEKREKAEEMVRQKMQEIQNEL